MYEKFLILLDRKRKWEGKNIKPADISRELFIHPSVFTDWKKGKSEPNARKLYKLAKYFDVPMEFFFEDEPF